MVNETAFQAFVTEIRDPSARITTVNELAKIADIVSLKLQAIDTSDSAMDKSLSDDEVRDITEQLGRIRQLFPASIGRSIVAEPIFPGCGFLDTCRGDVLQSATLYELKAGDRPFRSIDLRQLTTYATLNYVSKAYPIEAVAIANIRSGLVFEIALNDLTRQVSGRSPNELFELISYSLASGDMSR